MAVTTPYDEQYRETFVNRPVYERAQEGGRPVFYERHYDNAALTERLFSPARTKLVDLEFWGEGAVRMERIMNRLGPVRVLLSPLEPFLSGAFLRRVKASDGRRPMASFFTLQKK